MGMGLGGGRDDAPLTLPLLLTPVPVPVPGAPVSVPTRLVLLRFLILPLAMGGRGAAPPKTMPEPAGGGVHAAPGVDRTVLLPPSRMASRPLLHRIWQEMGGRCHY